MHTTNNFKRSFTFWLGLGLLLTQTFAHAESQLTERIEWKKNPIRLHLKVGHERLLHVPGSVKVGVPATLQSRLRTQSVNGTVYLRATAPFGTTRVIVRTIDGGQIYLFDISASTEGGQTHPVQVFVKAASERESGQMDSTIGSNHTATQTSYVILTRFAAQQLYAPARLVQNRSGTMRVPVARKPVALLRGGAVDATPLVAWRAGSLYVTALKLTNRTDQPQTLDPRHLRGSWLTAAFQHNRLLAAGSDADTTAVYLISARPFEVSQ